MRRPPRTACLVALAAAASFGCSDGSGASNEPRPVDAAVVADAVANSGSPTDAGGPIDARAAVDAHAAMDANTAVDAAEPEDAPADAAPFDPDAVSSDLPPACQPMGANGGSRWQDLYACYFGQTGIANCALNTGCHVTGGGGALYWVCDMTSDSCWQGMTTTIIAGVTDPADTALYAGLRKLDGTGDMPVTPGTLVFTNGDLARISTWIEGGAPNN